MRGRGAAVLDALNSAWVRLTETDLSGSAASIDLPAIPATFQHLVLLASLRTDRAGNAGDDALLTLNNDATDANYDRQLLNVTGAVVSASATNAVAGSRAALLTTGATAQAGAFDDNVAWLLDYSRTDRFKLVTVTSRRWQARSTMVVREHMIGWASTVAVNRLTLASNTGANFVAGCTVSLYGVKAGA